MENEASYIKCACQSCGGGLEFQTDAIGLAVDCPHCGAHTLLYNPDPPGVKSHQRFSKGVRYTTLASIGTLLLIIGIFAFGKILTWYHQSQALTSLSRGNEANLQGNFSQAVSYFNQTIQYLPENADAFFGRGAAKYRLQDYDGAFADFNRVIDLNPDFRDIYLYRGNVSFNAGRLDDAWEDFGKAISRNPGNAYAYCNRGYIENSRGDYDGALLDFNRAIEIEPSFTDAIEARKKLLAEHQNATPEPSLTSIKQLFQKKLNEDMQIKDEQGFIHNVPAPQALFNYIHPVGTGKDVTVLDVVLNKDSGGNIESIGLRLKLDWQGPLQSGSTIFQMVYDTATDQYQKIAVIKSDGITRDGLNEFANAFVVGAQIGAQLHNAFSGN